MRAVVLIPERFTAVKIATSWTCKDLQKLEFWRVQMFWLSSSLILKTVVKMLLGSLSPKRWNCCNSVLCLHSQGASCFDLPKSRDCPFTWIFGKLCTQVYILKFLVAGIMLERITPQSASQYTFMQNWSLIFISRTCSVEKNRVSFTLKPPCYVSLLRPWISVVRSIAYNAPLLWGKVFDLLTCEDFCSCWCFLILFYAG